MAQPMPPALPMFSPPPGKELWQLGRREDWPELEALLNGLDQFYVIDARTEAYSRDIARKFEESREDGGFRTAVHFLLCSSYGGDNHQLLKRILALGVHPDLPATSGWRPSHYCSFNGRKACAEVLAACRPDLSAKHDGGKTPLDLGIAELMWGNFKRNGFPCIAQLAHDQKWWAVKNLCRRRVVPEDEVTTVYRGKNALQWTEHHGQMSLLDEMRYLLQGFQQRLSIASLVQRKLDNEVTSKILIIEERQKQFRREFEEELSGMREAVRTCVSDVGGISGKLAEKLMQMEARNITEDCPGCEKKTQEAEERLLSSMQEQEDRFRSQLEILKEMIVARESIVDAQLKSIRVEVAKLAGSVNSLISTTETEAACSQQRGSGSTRKDARTSAEAHKDDVIKELLALAKKYGG